MEKKRIVFEQDDAGKWQCVQEEGTLSVNDLSADDAEEIAVVMGW